MPFEQGNAVHADLGSQGEALETESFPRLSSRIPIGAAAGDGLQAHGRYQAEGATAAAPDIS